MLSCEKKTASLLERLPTESDSLLRGCDTQQYPEGNRRGQIVPYQNTGYRNIHALLIIFIRKLYNELLLMLFI